MSVILLSGGLDSAVLLAREMNENGPQKCLAFYYEQRHQREIWCSYQVAHYYSSRWERINLPPYVFAGSALTGSGAVPHAHFEDLAQAATVVPNRNMAMLALAAAYAVRHGESEVLFASHAGDAAIYPDCRPEFVEAVDRAMRLACGVGVRAPFLGMTKREVVAIGRDLLVPFDMTWSCYEGGQHPCGGCGACVERKEALA